MTHTKRKLVAYILGQSYTQKLVNFKTKNNRI